jgi:hypothetical protein
LGAERGSRLQVACPPQPNGHSCLYHGECHSECCVRTGYSLERFCTSKTIFLQCVPWRKVSPRPGGSPVGER